MSYLNGIILLGIDACGLGYTARTLRERGKKGNKKSGQKGSWRVYLVGGARVVLFGVCVLWLLAFNDWIAGISMLVAGSVKMF